MTDLPTDRPTDIHDLRIYATSRRIKREAQAELGQAQYLLNCVWLFSNHWSSVSNAKTNSELVVT